MTSCYSIAALCYSKNFKKHNREHATEHCAPSECEILNGKFNFSQVDIFHVHATIDIAAENNKINGDELRDIIYNEVKEIRKIGDQTVDMKDFSITNLEGKKITNFSFDRMLQFIDKVHPHSFVCCFIS